MAADDVHERIREHARQVAETAPDYFTAEQRAVLSRTFIPALRRVRESQSGETA